MKHSQLRTEPVYIHNPLPENVTEADLWEAVDLFNEKARDEVPAFRLTYVWGGTGSDQLGNEEYDELTLDPGEPVRVDADAARIVLKTLGEMGAFVSESKEPEPKETLVALHKALEFYKERGPVQLVKYQQRHQLNEEQIRLERPNISAYLINAEKARLIEEVIKELRSSARGKPAATSA